MSILYTVYDMLSHVHMQNKIKYFLYPKNNLTLKILIYLAKEKLLHTEPD